VCVGGVSVSVWERGCTSAAAAAAAATRACKRQKSKLTRGSHLHPCPPSLPPCLSALITPFSTPIPYPPSLPPSPSLIHTPPHTHNSHSQQGPPPPLLLLLLLLPLLLLLLVLLVEEEGGWWPWVRLKSGQTLGSTRKITLPWPMPSFR